MPGNCPIPLRLPSPLVELADDRLAAAGVRVLLKREDLINPEIPGNKWRKLKYNLAAAKAERAETLLTFGGAYSNHLRAVAAAGHYFGFRTIGVVRGEEHLPLNDSLAYVVSRGMHLTYLDRQTYRAKTTPAVLATLRDEHGPFTLIPEGGSNALAVRGCQEIVHEIDVPFDVICCPCGTGGTLAGIAAALSSGQSALGFAALKGAQFLTTDVAALQREALGAPTTNWSIEFDYHHGGFAKSTPTLSAFIDTFTTRHDFRPDRVYVAKMLHGLLDLITQGRFPRNTTIIAVITG